MSVCDADRTCALCGCSLASGRSEARQGGPVRACASPKMPVGGDVLARGRAAESPGAGWCGSTPPGPPRSMRGRIGMRTGRRSPRSAPRSEPLPGPGRPRLLPPGDREAVGPLKARTALQASRRQSQGTPDHLPRASSHVRDTHGGRRRPAARDPALDGPRRRQDNTGLRALPAIGR